MQSNHLGLICKILIPNSDLILFCDGSATRPLDKQYLLGSAVTPETGVVKEHAMPPGTSAQQAESYALTRQFFFCFFLFGS